MTVLRRMWTGLVLGTAMISTRAVAQKGSVSLTHMVTVTVPARVAVQISSVAPAVQNTVQGSSVQATTNGLALSIRATQSWTLSISSARKSPLNRSHDQTSSFARVGAEAMIASGINSQAATDARVYFRDAADKSSNRSSTERSDAVILTVAAR